MTNEPNTATEYKLKTITFRADPALWGEFRSAVLLDGDTVQRVLESFVAEYVENAAAHRAEA